MAGISVQESSKAKRTPKVLHHLEIHPELGGGVRVEHHHASGYEHPMEPHSFSENEGEKFHEHIAKHTGMKHEEIEEQGGSEPDEYDKE